MKARTTTIVVDLENPPTWEGKTKDLVLIIKSICKKRHYGFSNTDKNVSTTTNIPLKQVRNALHFLEYKRLVERVANRNDCEIYSLNRHVLPTTLVEEALRDSSGEIEKVVLDMLNRNGTYRERKTALSKMSIIGDRLSANIGV